MRVRTAMIAALMTTVGCSEEPARVFRPDASPRDVSAGDTGPSVDTGAVTPTDAGVPVDRPPVQTVRDNVRPGAPDDSAMPHAPPISQP